MTRNSEKVLACTSDNYSKRRCGAVCVPKIRLAGNFSRLEERKERWRGRSRRTHGRSASVIVLFLITPRDEAKEKERESARERDRGAGGEGGRGAEACLPLRYAVNNKRL